MTWSAGTRQYLVDVSWFGEWESESEDQDAEVQGIQDWGGYPSDTGDYVHNALSYLHNAYHALKGKSKGKGKKGKGHFLHGKGYFNGKGTGTQVPMGSMPPKGYSKGYPKGNGKGKGQFNGECHYCGKWGHTARECKLKDSHMEQYRQNTQAANIEHQSHEYDGACDHDDNHVSALETLGGHRNMGHWELSHVSTSTVPDREKNTHEQIMSGLVAKNPFIVSDRAKKDTEVIRSNHGRSCRKQSLPCLV